MVSADFSRPRPVSEKRGGLRAAKQHAQEMGLMELVGVSAENGAFAPFAGVGRFVSCELPLRHVDLMLGP